MNCIVFSPHPDDAILGCGGSLIKSKPKTTIVYMTDGEAGSLTISKTQLAKIRKQESKKAAKLIGIKDTIFLKNQDGYLEYNKQNLIKITSLIRKIKPDIIYLPNKDDNHPDHKKTYELVTESIRRAAGPWFQECKGKPWKTNKVLNYEVWTPLQTISHTEDISNQIDKKMKALSMYKSQMKDIKYDKAIKSLNRYRGIMTNQGEYCECFSVIYGE